MIDPSSKLSLKVSCLATAKGDIDYAQKLYDFFASDIDSMPDFNAPKPSTFQQIKDGAGQVFGWVKENKDDIMQAVGYIRALRGGVEPTAPVEIPPLPNQ